MVSGECDSMHRAANVARRRLRLVRRGRVALARRMSWVGREVPDESKIIKEERGCRGGAMYNVYEIAARVVLECGGWLEARLLARLASRCRMTDGQRVMPGLPQLDRLLRTNCVPGLWKNTVLRSACGCVDESLARIRGRVCFAVVLGGTLLLLCLLRCAVQPEVDFVLAAQFEFDREHGLTQ